MEDLAEYVFRISSASIAAGIILALVRGSSQENLIKILCGIFMTITALSPISTFRVPDLMNDSISFSDQAEHAVKAGEDLANQMRSEIIKQQTESYILDKAAVSNMELNVNVQVLDGLPRAIYLCGEYSEIQKENFSAMITDELGIPKENQQWIGRK